ncbi:MscL family protein [Calditerrivibrio nitroreducens]|uniref:Large-conductance mechanosensitive channel n=1 Tax=Calditerrivibrio nitroreducens (strain DSM 19672 / NBRC 101217 / Yu37-1) TaxID=768670 RepID=E4TFW5_CALNY|nr:MscL family protein [Calditerrivibrio nitroreducens]ADR19621.1 large-conductance mechanosensitive channel [Calditerrivibrio nitroreducens DSM 19672]
MKRTIFLLMFLLTVSSLFANDYKYSIVGLLGGSHDFSGIKIGPVGIGKFINAVLNFLIVSSVVFFGIIKPIKKLNELAAKKESAKQQTEQQPTTPEDVKLLREILEELKKQKV